MDSFGNLLHSDGAGGDVLVVDRYQGGRERASERARELSVDVTCTFTVYVRIVCARRLGWMEE